MYKNISKQEVPLEKSSSVLRQYTKTLFMRIERVNIRLQVLQVDQLQITS